MARIILLLSGALIAAIAVPAYFLLCLWISIAETFLHKKGDKHHGKRKHTTH